MAGLSWLRPLVFACRMVLVMALALGGVKEGFSQIPTIPGQQTYPPGFQSNPSFQTSPSGVIGPTGDTLALDSAAAPDQSKIKPDARRIRPQLLFRSQPFESQVSFDIANLPYWDRTDTITAFVQHLGTILKPYQAFRDGLEESLLDMPFWRNPVTGRYNRYFYHPAYEVPYFDTRTPFVNVHYSQLPNQSNLIEVTVSRNINPQWNATAFYRRHRFVGEYRNSVSDQTVLVLSAYYRSVNRRYHVFANAGYNDASDQLNGGTPRTLTSQYPIVDGVVNEVGTIYLDPISTFYKDVGPTMIGDGQAKHFRRTAFAEQYYRLIGFGDSVKSPHRLVLRHSADYSFQYRRFISANGVSQSILASNLVAVMPTLAVFGDNIAESYASADYGTGGEASYDLQGPLNLHLEAGIDTRRLEVTNEDQNFRMTAVQQRAAASLVWKGVEFRGKAFQQLSNRFSPERSLSLGASISPLPAQPRYVVMQKGDTALVPDSVEPPRDRKPLTVFGNYDFFDRNPSVWQRYLTGREGVSSYAPNESLVNQKISHLRAGIRWDFPVRVRGEDTLQAHQAEAALFLSGADRAIYYDSLLAPLQAPAGAGYTWAGIELRYRLRFWKKFHWESRVVAQRGTTSATDALRLHAQHLPTVYGKSSLFYDNRNLKIAAIFRVGIDVFFQTDFTGQAFDPLSGEFFPSFYRAPGFARVDGYWAMKLSKTFIYIKMSHLNEGFPFPGYYTTPLYPMQGRTLALGVHWNFFD